MLFFQNNILTKGSSATIEELISHEVGKHNMMGQRDVVDPETNLGIYPQYPDLGSNQLGKTYPTKSNTLEILNKSVDRAYISYNSALENLNQTISSGRNIAQTALAHVGESAINIPGK